MPALLWKNELGQAGNSLPDDLHTIRVNLNKREVYDL